MINTYSKLLIGSSNRQVAPRWIDLPFTEDEFNEMLEEMEIDPDAEYDFDSLMAGNSPSDTYEVLDFSSEILTQSDCENPYSASDLVERIEDLQDYEYDSMVALINSEGYSLEEAIDKVEDGDVDFYPRTTLTELAEQFADEGIFSKETLLECIDYEKLGELLSEDGYTEVNGGVLRVS